eukprot:7328467-Pyramimonas_sp.AAC.1
MFKLEWDETFFAGLDQMDCTEPERAALQTLQQDLLNTRGQLEGKEKEITQWLEQAKKFQQDITDR